MKPKPSYFDADLASLDDDLDAETLTEIESDPSLRHHLRQVSQRAGPAPEWASHRKTARRWVTPVWVGTLLAASIAVMFLKPGAPTGPRVRTKGSDEALVYVQRDGEVRQWDEKSSLRAGVALQIAVASDARAVAVFVQTDSAWTRLNAARLIEDKRVVLSGAWRLDGEREQERLRVVFGERISDLSPELARRIELLIPVKKTTP